MKVIAMPPRDGSVAAVFLAIGVDISNNDDVQDLAETVRWARAQKRDAEERRKNMVKGMWGVLAAVVTALAAAFGSILPDMFHFKH